MAKKRIPNLIVEFASDSGTMFFLSVLQYRKEDFLVVVDNISSEEVGAYVLDFAQQEQLNVQELMSLVTRWFYESSMKHPLSFELSKLGIGPAVNRIYKTFELAHVTRLIGYDFRYDFETAPKIRRRRVSLIPAGAEIRLKRSTQDRTALEGLQKATSQLKPEAQASSSVVQMFPS